MAAAWPALPTMAGQEGQPVDLDKVFNEGMVAGADLCTGQKEAR